MKPVSMHTANGVAHRRKGPGPARRRALGVTLIELMVGALIGLLATVVIAQVAKVFEAGKRNTTSGSDAQLNGALALHTLQREIQAAGYGLTSSGAAGCRMSGRWNTAAFNWTLAPVIITDGASGAADTLRVLGSAKTNFSVPMQVFSDHPRNGTEFVMGTTTGALTNVGNSAGDLVVAIPKVVDSTSVCALFQVSRVCDAAAPTAPCTSANGLRHDVTDSVSNVTYPWNQDGNDGTRTVFPGTTAASISYVAESRLINLGILTDRTFSLNGSSLQVTTFQSSAPAASTVQELFPQIVNLQAVYGKDTNGDGVIDAWNATLPSTPGEWGQVRAVRVALAARSTQYEADTVTTTQPTWTPDGTTATTIRVNQLTDWQHYRYRVFEAVIPLRNMLWQS